MFKACLSLILINSLGTCAGDTDQDLPCVSERCVCMCTCASMYVCWTLVHRLVCEKVRIPE